MDIGSARELISIPRKLVPPLFDSDSSSFVRFERRIKIDQHGLLSLEDDLETALVMEEETTL